MSDLSYRLKPTTILIRVRENSIQIDTGKRLIDIGEDVLDLFVPINGEASSSTDQGTLPLDGEPQPEPQPEPEPEKPEHNPAYRAHDGDPLYVYNGQYGRALFLTVLLRKILAHMYADSNEGGAFYARKATIRQDAIFGYLMTLEKRGLIVGTRQPVGSGFPRVRWSLTDFGQKRVEWLTTKRHMEGLI